MITDGLTHPDTARTRRATRWAVGAALLCLVLGLIGYPRLQEAFFVQAGKRGEATLRLAVEGLNEALSRYEPLPALIAERPALKALLMSPDDPVLLAEVNERLRQTIHTLGVSDIYLMDTTGMTLAASSYDKQRSFVGRSFSYRPYFTQALDGGTGRYFALGTTSGERGYFFAAPVEDGDRIIGVLALKFTVGGFEETWRQNESDLIVTDHKGIVFMSNRRDWHFRALEPLSGRAVAEIEAQRQYPLGDVLPLDNSARVLRDGLTLRRFTTGGERQEFVSSSQTIPKAGWTVTILTPTGPARAQAANVVMIAVAAVLIVGLVVLNVGQRRARLRDRMEAERAQTALLERRVRERTAELNAANEQLQQEVEERKTAETRLRSTQTELVQAGKLAALGQMSAALSHEFNQPLTAVRSYAENAVLLLKAGKTGAAGENLGHISGMVERMASISKHLRSFARRPGEAVNEIPLAPILRDALALARPRLDAAGAVVDAPDSERMDIWVHGGHVRLQQVMLNLLTNALDAMDGQGAPLIEITIDADAEQVILRLRDHGDGLDTETAERLFDPFFTTKQPGKGMGLGLSISYNIVRDFGGTLSARNHPEGGAVFELALCRATAQGQEIAAQ
ncbi:ATP-binding protein [Qingshengfaniella alkalisoli]|uniref:C4-dicarboxylate transport sensor protein DctB n=1 Tax=Qingshengfaniella alkalisoli TaxID=2599296 RepID=A0A5B8I961_9RHOB|nr:ATP-binding protein [Qingshengfaniella alkalisoli]QDY70735.1 sensor histidine kinase [Qingshengfaniella alkalisoli]